MCFLVSFPFTDCKAQYEVFIIQWTGNNLLEDISDDVGHYKLKSSVLSLFMLY